MTTHGRSTLAQLRELQPYHFEQFVADLWERVQGWETNVTSESRDWGADVVGRPPDQEQYTVVQAKRYAADNPVSSDAIQQYSALEQQYEYVVGVTVVTTSYFTDPAEQAADRLDVRCIDGDGLVTLIDRHDAHEILDWYAAGKPTDW